MDRDIYIYIYIYVYMLCTSAVVDVHREAAGVEEDARAPILSSTIEVNVDYDYVLLILSLSS